MQPQNRLLVRQARRKISIAQCDLPRNKQIEVHLSRFGLDTTPSSSQQQQRQQKSNFFASPVSQQKSHSFSRIQPEFPLVRHSNFDKLNAASESADSFPTVQKLLPANISLTKQVQPCPEQILQQALHPFLNKKGSVMEGENKFEPLSQQERLRRYEASKFQLKQGLLEKVSKQDTNLQGKISLKETQKKVEQRKPEDVYNAHAEESGQIGQKFMNRMRYVRLFKENQQLADEKMNFTQDPRVQYFLQCQIRKEADLPLFEKIINKTLVLHDYTLSESHFQGLAKACGLLSQVNRVSFCNNNIDGKQFAGILNGLNKLDDLKSITYKLNAFSYESLTELQAIFKRPFPYQLEELRMIDCKISTKLCDSLLKAIAQESKITKLTLSNIHMSGREFSSVISMVQNSDILRELDLSWCEVRRQNLAKLIEAMSENRTLTHVSLAWNELLELPQQRRLSQTQSKLTPENKEVVGNLCRLIRHNYNLQMLNLSHMTIVEPALKRICKQLKFALGLQSLNLSGNPGVTPHLCDFVRDYLDVTNPANFRVVEPYRRQQQHAFQDGLELREVEKSKKMAKLGLNVLGGQQCYLVLSRKLGFSQFVDQAEKWQLKTSSSQDCYISNQYGFVVFMWSQKVGQLFGQDEGEQTYYKDVISKFGDPITSEPTVYGEFTEWKPQKMVELLPFLIEHDTSPPDFIGELLEEGKVPSSARQFPKSLSEDQERFLMAKKEVYYKREALNVLKGILPLKNVDFLPKFSEQSIFDWMSSDSPHEKLWLWMEFLKPGKCTICVRALTGESKKTKFYVHKQICHPRIFEDLPQAYVSQPPREKRDFSQPLVIPNIFKGLSVDTPEILGQAFRTDSNYIKLDQIIDEDRDKKMSEQVLRENFHILNAICNYLRSLSPTFPKFDSKVLEIHFFDKLMLDEPLPQEQKQLLAKTLTQETIARHQFLTMIVKLAIFVYKPHPDNKGQPGNPAVNLTSQALRRLLCETLVPFQLQFLPNCHKVRETQVWKPQVATLIELNEPALAKVFHMLNQTSKESVNDALTVNDVHRFCNMMDFRLSRAQIIQIFVQSKATVVQDGDVNSRAMYNKMTFGEFLDFVCMLTLKVYDESEMKTLNLVAKLTFVLRTMFALVGEKIAYPEPGISENPFGVEYASSEEEEKL